MSHSQSTASSSDLQQVINNALKTFEKRTKMDLLSHFLASQLQACNSPGAILSTLQWHVQGQDRSQSSCDRWANSYVKWLNPIVTVLYPLSETLGEGVGLVSLGT
jgi:hypothetical protein